MCKPLHFLIWTQNFLNFNPSKTRFYNYYWGVFNLLSQYCSKVYIEKFSKGNETLETDFEISKDWEGEEKVTFGYRGDHVISDRMRFRSSTSSCNENISKFMSRMFGESHTRRLMIKHSGPGPEDRRGSQSRDNTSTPIPYPSHTWYSQNILNHSLLIGS